MSLAGVRRKLLCGAMLFALAGLLPARAAHRSGQAQAAAIAHGIVLAVDPAQSTLHWTLGSTLHTVHGTFALKRGTVRLDPVTNSVSGEIVADATSGQSGNGSRDKRMHKEILDSQHFTEVVFRPEWVEGKVPLQGAGTVQLHGTFVLRGSEHELTVPVQVELANDQWSGTAKFAIPFVQWGLKNPSNFLLKVDSAVSIDMEMKGTLRRSPGP